MSLKNKKILGNARLFMSRVQLSGNEVPAYIEVMQYIEKCEAGEDEDEPAVPPAGGEGKG